MKIGIDGRPFQGKLTGIGRYTLELCRELNSLLPDAEFYVYSHVPINLPVNSKNWFLRLDPNPFAKYLKPVVWLKTRCGKLCKSDDLDIFWASGSFFPFLGKKVKRILTVYDLNYKLAPETMSIFNRFSFFLFFKKDLLKSDAVLSISKGTSDRLKEYFGIEANAIIPPAVSSIFRPQPEEAIKRCLNKYKISSPYFLSLGTWEPRKNFELLIKAFIEFKNENPSDPTKLLLIGGKGWKTKEFAKLTKNISKNYILHLGYIQDVDLPMFYSGATAFIFPSKYEGFGIPVLEAANCGTNVIATDLPELREAGGELPIYISPTKEGIKRGILQALNSEFMHSRSGKHYPQFSWKENAKIFYQMFF